MTLADKVTPAMTGSSTARIACRLNMAPSRTMNFSQWPSRFPFEAGCKIARRRTPAGGTAPPTTRTLGFCRLGAFFQHAAVEKTDGAVGELGVARIVGHHADGGPGGVQFAQKTHDGLTVGGIQVAGGLVREQD